MDEYLAKSEWWGSLSKRLLRNLDAKKSLGTMIFHVTVTYAQSIDGCIAAADGTMLSLSSSESFKFTPQTPFNSRLYSRGSRHHFKRQSLADDEAG